MSARCAGRSEPATNLRHGQPSYTQAVTAELRIATAMLESVQDDRVIRGYDAHLTAWTRFAADR